MNHEHKRTMFTSVVFWSSADLRKRYWLIYR